MRRVLVIALIALVASVLASAAPAAKGGGGWAWTHSKAERVVERDATIRLPAAESALLESELRRQLAFFGALELLASEEGDANAQGRYHSLANQYLRTLRSVQFGLRITEANCTGAGRAVGADRFKTFDCLATSEVLRIPSVEVDMSLGATTPVVVEADARELGPMLTQLRVRVTGRSTIAYQ
jgi:hypothetical protein